uniref:tRNA(Ile)-lysidine/2-thiocytidine synthase N-terminal domain-containing protein n=2 Tax=Leptocylindrus danicus TaxID=163516 RepID=A0A7S2NZ83_9STRA|mmetsp:Transcript_17909/g.26672  ORF Transcript_17909/g.26672 Transcript_17909/m.26672 type:complete len:710 (+) Transcript_17909:727-2856(+)
MCWSICAASDGVINPKKNGKYMSTAANKNILDALINDKAELLRPGFTRLSLNYTLSPQEIHYTLKSIVWVCRNAYKLCGSGIYAMNSRTGEWRHQSRQGRPLGFERIWLSHYNEKPLSSSMNGDKKSVIVASSLAENIERANDILETLSATKPSAVAELYDEVRWFLTPADCALLMTANAQSNHSFCPVSPSLLGAIQPPDQTNPASPIDDSVTNTSFANVVSKLYPFRDGDSAGEATLEEIFEGYDDGELSDACVVFVDDEWIGVKSAQNTSKVIVNNNLCTNYSAEKVEGPPPAEESLPIEEQKSHVDVALEMDQFFPGSDIAEPKKPRKRKFIVPPKKFLGPIKKALIEHEMIAENDVLLLGLSGGKDSLSLLHILIYLQTKLPQKFTLKVLTVDPMSSGFDPSSLIDYIASLRDGYGNEIEYHYVRDDIMGRAYENNYGGDEKKRVTSICAYCARMKRGIMYSTMRKCGANKLVLAQHLDDLVESTMMSIMHNGFLRTMKTHYTINIGDLAVIRPLSYTRESELTQFALANNLPVINENCPACFEEPKERARIKKLLSREENLFSNLYDNMRKAILPLMHADTESIMWSYTNMITEKSNKEKKQERKKLLREQKKRAQSNGGQNDNVDNETKIPDVTGNSNPHIPKLLSEVPEGELVVELARRRAAKFALKGSLQKTAEAKNTDEAPVCSINGGPGTVPCYQLME